LTGRGEENWGQVIFKKICCGFQQKKPVDRFKQSVKWLCQGRGGGKPGKGGPGGAAITSRGFPEAAFPAGRFWGKGRKGMLEKNPPQKPPGLTPLLNPM